jgi:hypothetical protein
MSWVITGSQPFPAVIGEEFGGGYFAGYISHTADGSPTHALIVAPRADGATGTGYTLTTNLAWATNTTTGGVNYSTTTIGTNTAKDYDGKSVMDQVVALGNIANFPAFEFCKNLSIGGFNDWYLPARWELEIAYFNLKPSTVSNNTAFGINDYSVPKRTLNYLTNYPAQTYITAFNTSTEGFIANLHLSSTEISATGIARSNLSTGNQIISGAGKVLTDLRTRAFRRIAL